MKIDVFPEQLNEYISQLHEVISRLRSDSPGGSGIHDDTRVETDGQDDDANELARLCLVNGGGATASNGLQSNIFECQGELMGLLLMIESVYSTNIHSNLIDGESQLVDCFVRVVNPTLSGFRKILSSDKSPYRAQWQAQFFKLNKHFSMFLKELVKRLNQMFGTTEELRSIIHTLGRYLAEDNDILETAHASSSNEMYLNKIYGHSLCKLGDFSRYRAAYSDESDYKHAFAYYKACIVVWKGEGTPWNQMGVIHYSQREYIEAYYCFNKSLCIQNPFKDSNMMSVLKKFLKTSVDDIKYIGDGSSKEGCLAIAGVVKRVAEYDFLCFKSNSMPSSQPLDDRAEYKEIQALVLKLLQCIEEGQISYKSLVRLTIILVMVNWRLSRENGVSEYSKGLFALTMAIFQGICKATLNLGVTVSDNSSKQKIDAFIILLPCLRVLLDWLAKDFDEYSFAKDNYATTCLNEVVQLLEWLRVQYGFHFDSLTAAAMQSGRYSPMAFFEEIECYECSALWGSLNDTPSGINLKFSKGNDPNLFRSQCILFSGVRAGLDRDTLIGFDSAEQKFYFKEPERLDFVDSLQSPTLEVYSEMTLSDITDKDDDEEDDEEIVFRPRGK